MTFEELLTQVRELLQNKGRISYRALKLQFHIDDEYIAGLKDELIDAERVATETTKSQKTKIKRQRAKVRKS